MRWGPLGLGSEMDASLGEFWEEYTIIPYTVVPGSGYALHLILCIAKHAACFATALANKEEGLVSAERCFTRESARFLTKVGVDPSAFDYCISGTTIDASGRVKPRGAVMFNGTRFVFEPATGQLVLDQVRGPIRC